ncbi:hypothetical protein Sango_2837200 [Sesamum angolense]|uniref:6,7-dimethyl-8-ribityllumazine synthase n=1 Tax=Sesamum angolense TaxID=2727404 RepID=A0AAE1W0E5_9LAMI|nr:hypothetical protein Sango_2837200 [Sesamum angolense]
MGNSLRCCLACVLPCGALDLIRIVHLNGSVEEITGRVTAGEVLKNNPNHVLTKPCSQGMTRRILILSPESELKRGSIYFLIPASSLPAEKNSKILKKFSSSKKKSSSAPEVISSHQTGGKDAGGGHQQQVVLPAAGKEQKHRRTVEADS